MTVTVLSQVGGPPWERLVLPVTPDTLWHDVAVASAVHFGVEQHRVRLLDADTRRVRPEHTLADDEVEDGDQVYFFVEQLGD